MMCLFKLTTRGDIYDKKYMISAKSFTEAINKAQDTLVKYKQELISVEKICDDNYSNNDIMNLIP